jgi:histidine triad (HIT) family protein
MEDCIFCKIAAGKIPAKKIAESKDCLAFPDIDPQAPVHVLVIPKKHIKSLDEAGDLSIVSKMYALGLQVAKQLGIDKTGHRTVINTGLNGVQTVLHLHMHLLGGRTMTWPPG